MGASEVTGRAAGPLAGRRVLVTRPAHQIGELAERIRAAGGWPLEAPTVRTEPGDDAALDDAVRRLVDGGFAGLCVTSVNGVRALAAACRRSDVDPAEVLAPARLIGAVGPRTAAAVEQHLGVRATLVPDRATGAALGAAVPAGDGAVLLPRGDLAGDAVADGLRAGGWTPVPVVAYRTVTVDALPDAVLAALGDGQVDLIAVTSASTARGLVELLGDRPWSGQVVTIGPVTSDACRDLGLDVAAEADPHDLDGLVAALVAVSDRLHGARPGPSDRTRRPADPS